MYTSKYEIIIFAGLILTRIGQGIYSTIPSTTLLDFAHLYDTDIANVSKIYSARSFGQMVGSIIVAIFMSNQKCEKLLDPMVLSGIFVFLTGILATIAPLMPNLPLVAVVILAGNVFYGWMDLCLQSMVIRAWGIEYSKPLVQAYHGFWSFGAFIAPYVSLPFTELTDDDDVCDTGKINTDPDPVGTSFSTSLTQTEGGVPQLFWPWLITGVFFLVGGSIIFYAGITKLRFKVQEKIVGADIYSPRIWWAKKHQPVLENLIRPSPSK